MFGEFLDYFHGVKNMDITPEEAEFVMDIVKASQPLYDDDHKRLEALGPLLERMFQGHDFVRAKGGLLSDRGQADGHISCRIEGINDKQLLLIMKGQVSKL